MKRIISFTTALALSLAGPAVPLMAQDYPQALIGDQLVLCLPNKRTECPEGAMCIIVKNPENCEARAAIFLEEMASGLEAPALPDPAATELTVEEVAPVEQAAPAVVEEVPASEAAPVEPAPAEAVAPVEEVPAEQPAVEEVQPVAEPDPVVVDPQAPEPVPEPVAEPVVEPAPEPVAEPVAEPIVEPVAEPLAEPAPETAPAPEVVVVEEAPPSDAVLEENAPLAFDPFEVFVADQPVLCLPDASIPCPEGAICTVSAAAEDCQINADKKIASLAPVEVVIPDAEEVEALAEIIADPVLVDHTAIDAVAQSEPVSGDEPALPADIEVSPDAEVTEEVLSEEDTRSATEEFEAAPTEVAPGKKSGLTDLEIAGLAILGTLAIGAILDKDRTVVENTGDRVVVQDQNGNYNIYKDDNALLREPGSTVRTETFADGSSRTVTVREDGSQVVTIRDATGRVLQRSAYDATGLYTPLIDDLSPEQPIDVDLLPPANTVAALGSNASLPDIWDSLDAIERADYAHNFSLRQIRENRQVRDLAPTIDVNNVTFDSGSSAIRKSEARKLQSLGRLINALIEDNSSEIFLIEGHTDAVGRAGYNLALSDRRAESVARALTEFYDVPAENLVVQGYGEKELKIDTDEDERQNRRAVVRIITPLLKMRGG